MAPISHIADYVVLRETPGGNTVRELTLNRSDPVQERQLRIHLPARAVIEEPAVLAFVADPASYAEGLKFEVSVLQSYFPPGAEDPTETIVSDVGWHRFRGGVARGLWYTLRGNILNLETPSESHPLNIPGHLSHVDGRIEVTARFKVTDGSGLVIIRHVVLWFQRQVSGVH